MSRAISTYAFQHAQLGVQRLDQMLRAGFTEVEIYCARSHFDYANPTHVRDIAEWFADAPVKLHALHAPVYRGVSGDSPHAVLSIAFLERQRRQDSMDEIKRALEVAERAPYRYLIAHLGVPGEEYDPRKFDAALTSLEHLRLFARQRGVEILIENILNDLSTPARLREFMEHAHMRDLKVCLDTGHAHLDGGVEAALDTLRGSIASAHVHDNGGTRDEHLPPGEGQVAWATVVPALRRQNGDVSMVLELRGSEAHPVHLENASAAAARLARMAEETLP